MYGPGNFRLCPVDCFHLSGLCLGRSLQPAATCWVFQICDLATGQWSDLAKLGKESIAMYTTSRNLKYFYYLTPGPELKLFRIRMTDLQSEFVTSLKDLPFAAGAGGYWAITVTPDGSPVLTRELGNPEIYALTVKWP